MVLYGITLVPLDKELRALRALRYLEFLTQEAKPIGEIIIDAQNGFNKLSRFEMLWNVRHTWPEGARFAFN